MNNLERVASYLRGKNYFDEDVTQNYLVFQGVYKHFEDVNASKTIIINFFMLIHGYQKDYLMKQLVLLVDLNVHL